jgi:hypothetical protein
VVIGREGVIEGEGCDWRRGEKKRQREGERGKPCHISQTTLNLWIVLFKTIEVVMGGFFGSQQVILGEITLLVCKKKSVVNT